MGCTGQGVCGSVVVPEGPRATICFLAFSAKFLEASCISRLMAPPFIFHASSIASSNPSLILPLLSLLCRISHPHLWVLWLASLLSPAILIPLCHVKATSSQVLGARMWTSSDSYYSADCGVDDGYVGKRPPLPQCSWLSNRDSMVPSPWDAKRCWDQCLAHANFSINMSNIQHQWDWAHWHLLLAISY